MCGTFYLPYAPLQVLKPFADEIWIVDGPEIGMRYFPLTIPFPTRMTVVRLPTGGLWIHSPIAWDDRLGESLARLGRVEFLIAPNTLHYWYLPEWQARFPDARSYGPPKLRRRAKRRISIGETLGDSPPAAWDGIFDQCLVEGPVLTEADFFHRPSRTLILTDLIENFEPDRVRSRLLRWAIRLAGAADPDGGTPLDMRWSFAGNKQGIRSAVGRLIAWEPERIILAHGRCYPENGAVEVRRAFRWAM